MKFLNKFQMKQKRQVSAEDLLQMIIKIEKNIIETMIDTIEIVILAEINTIQDEMINTDLVIEDDFN